MESPARSAAGSQMEALIGLLQDVFRPIVLEAVAGQLMSISPAARDLENLRHKEYLSAKEVEDLYGLNAKTLACWRSQNRGPHYSKDGHLIRYRRKDIEMYLVNNTVKVFQGGAPCK